MAGDLLAALGEPGGANRGDDLRSPERVAQPRPVNQPKVPETSCAFAQVSASSSSAASWPIRSEPKPRSRSAPSSNRRSVEVASRLPDGAKLPSRVGVSWRPRTAKTLARVVQAAADVGRDVGFEPRLGGEALGQALCGGGRGEPHRR